MNGPKRWLWVAMAVAATSGRGESLIQNGAFEALPFGTGWVNTVATSITGLNGSATAARLPYNTTGSLYQRFTPLRDFQAEFSTRALGTNAERSLNAVFHANGFSASGGGAAINLRIAAGGVLQAYNGAAWSNLSATGSFAPNAEYRFRLVAWGFGEGTSTVHYTVGWSEAGSTDITHAVTNADVFHSRANAGAGGMEALRFPRLSTAYNTFDLDDVTLENLATDAVVRISGTYPHLAVFNGEGECGIGAVAPWAGRLWFLTYPPHQPQGSADKLYALDTNLVLTARPESVGGTHAARMIHRESGQMIIGPYFIASNGTVRAANLADLYGRLTAVARHLTDPANRVYVFEMEGALYEVDVATLAVTRIYDGNHTRFPGVHGKGGYSGQGRLIVANNGEGGWDIAADPGFNGPAGVLAESDGSDWSNNWSTVERRTFCDVTGPGGLYGNDQASDPVWATGWDKRSVILKLLDGGQWRTFRLPKASYSHDALHGWYTEWPRIRQVRSDGARLMHMHGMFYRFPGAFAAAQTGGIEPLSTYLKMPVDYCEWNGEIAMARDDVSTLQNSFAGQSHSALWFGTLEDLAGYGAPAGWGGPWIGDAVAAGAPSDPFLVGGFRKRVLHLRNAGAAAAGFALQYDPDGAGAWRTLTSLSVPAGGYTWWLLPPSLTATWVRLVPDVPAAGITAYFHLGNPAPPADAARFAGLAAAASSAAYSDGILRPASGAARTLQFAASRYDDGGGLAETAFYQIGGAFVLGRATNTPAETELRTTYGLSTPGFTADAASVIVTDGASTFRLPRGPAVFDSAFASGWPRGLREVVTERSLFQAHGTFYEVPRSGSGGFRRMRPVASHDRHVTDFGAWRGLFVMSGVAAAATNDGHVFRSDDGQAALWFGNVDDLWRMGAPRGTGGPWANAAVTAGAPSDPYLMAGYDRKVMELSHAAPGPVTFTVEVDFLADGSWSEYGRFTVGVGETRRHVFPDGYAAHWVRVKADADTTATAWFTYGPALPNQAFLDWAEVHQLGAAPVSELVQRDDDGDGVKNLAEYVQGSDPKQADASSAWTLPRVDAGVVNARATEWYADPDLQTGTEFSTNLLDWTDAPAGWEADGVDQSGLPAGFWRREWLLPDADRLFLRRRFALP